MLPNLRPSILHRHRKSASLGAEESSEKEHKADEARPLLVCWESAFTLLCAPRSDFF